MRGILLCAVLATWVYAQTKGPIQPREPRPKRPAATAEPEEKRDEAPKAASGAPCISDPDDTGPPKLRRGRPGERNPAPNCDSLPIALSGSPPEDDSSLPPLPPLLAQVRERAFRYTEELPNFICEQLIRRYSSGLLRDWKLRDTITAEVMFVDGREDYRNVKRNGRPTEWADTQRTGSWSEGEYGTILRDLLHPSTGAKFTYSKKDVIGSVETEVYSYLVEQPNSHWTLRFGGQMTKPRYRGRVWADAKELLLRRIEMEALELPLTFPISHAEMTLDYGPVRIERKFYTLPARSENLACFRSERACSRNEIEFRNYRKFTAESSVSTTDSTITFDPPKKK
ncbi:MAG: hypothetical protein HY235_04105 [Acidobacteria bacterium]|nr:hypothetical protein [Acidobacteriota bacterium]